MFKACHPLTPELLGSFGFEYNADCPIHTAAVCVYPSKVKSAFNTLKQLGFENKINVASGISCY